MNRAFGPDSWPCHKPWASLRGRLCQRQRRVLKPAWSPVCVYGVVGTSRCDVRAACSGATPSKRMLNFIRGSRAHPVGEHALRRKFFLIRVIREIRGSAAFFTLIKPFVL